MTAYIDKQDAHLLTKYRWWVAKNKHVFYVKTEIRENGKKRSIGIHQFILGFPSQPIDHKDGNGLNNRRKNLRACTPLQNTQNCRVQSNSTTGFKGVTFDKRDNKYHVRITVNKKQKSGGLYTDILRAAQKYNEMAIKYFGEFARLNEFTEEQKSYLSTPYIKEKKKIKSNPTGYVGVVKVNENKPFRAVIWANKRTIYLGNFHTAKEAAKAYNDAVFKYKREMAYLNKL